MINARPSRGITIPKKVTRNQDLKGLKLSAIVNLSYVVRDVLCLAAFPNPLIHVRAGWIKKSCVRIKTSLTNMVAPARAVLPDC
jgi:hypothetical protein